METRIRRFFLNTGIVCFIWGMLWQSVLAAEPGAEAAQVKADSQVKADAANAAVEPLLMPSILRMDLEEADIDTENFEIGIHFGKHSVEDFGVNNLMALTLAYHISEDLFVEASLGDSDLQPPIEERFIQGLKFARNSELDFVYYDLSIGYNILPGEAFVWRNRVFNSQLYLVTGIGVADHFRGEKDTMLTLGLGYRLIVIDQIALHISFRDHVFKRTILPEVLGDDVIHNFEIRTGISYFF